jgi:hypothetical protein
MKTTIGLFGTCGNSTWRDNFIALYKEKGINYFNPQLPEGTWTPECADIENQHFKKDDIVLFPVTNETTAFGSLAEVGFSINTLLENIESHRYFIFMINDDCIVADEEQRTASVRARKLVKSKLIDCAHPNVFIVKTLDEMKELSLKLYEHVYNWNEINLKYAY